MSTITRITTVNQISGYRKYISNGPPLNGGMRNGTFVQIENGEIHRIPLERAAEFLSEAPHALMQAPGIHHYETDRIKVLAAGEVDTLCRPSANGSSAPTLFGNNRIVGHLEVREYVFTYRQNGSGANASTSPIPPPFDDRRYQFSSYGYRKADALNIHLSGSNYPLFYDVLIFPLIDAIDEMGLDWPDLEQIVVELYLKRHETCYISAEFNFFQARTQIHIPTALISRQ